MARVSRFAAREFHGNLTAMALVRILVDGYSLLHSWPALARGRARHSAAARDELVRVLARYSDAAGIPVTVVFDGAAPPGSRGQPLEATSVEILFSRSGQTADQIIERVAHRMQPYGEVLAITNDHAERDTVIAMGGLASSCENFILTLEGALQDLTREIQHYNSVEKRRYKRS